MAVKELETCILTGRKSLSIESRKRCWQLKLVHAAAEKQRSGALSDRVNELMVGGEFARR